MDVWTYSFGLERPENDAVKKVEAAIAEHRRHGGMGGHRNHAKPHLPMSLEKNSTVDSARGGHHPPLT
jgi:hypothetical protein